MFSRILAGAISMLVGVIVIAVSAASAAAADDDPGADATSSPPELTVAPPTDYPDVRLFNAYARSGQAAFNPIEPKRLVVGIAAPGRCYVKRSADGGRTWGALVELPLFAGAIEGCTYEASPAVAYAAGGGRLYAAYTYTRWDVAWRNGVAVSVSTDQGVTWSTPTNALPERDTSNRERYGDVRLAAAPSGGQLYVAAFWNHHWGDRNVYFSSSGNQGSGWTPGKTIAWGNSTVGTSLSGFALAAGRGGNVLVAYGLGRYLDTGHSYTVQVARSADRGASFFYGIADQSDGYDDPDPDIKIGPFGTAHLVYAKGQNPGAAILYKYSFPPYGSWSAAPVRLDDDVPQAYVGTPRLAVGACGQASLLHATWLGLDYYPSEILYTRKVAQPGYAWSEPLKVGHLDRIYENGLAAAGPKAFSVFQGGTPEQVIAGSRVSSGVTCP